jgi:hypothetical protein
MTPFREFPRPVSRILVVLFLILCPWSNALDALSAQGVSTQIAERRTEHPKLQGTPTRPSDSSSSPSRNNPPPVPAIPDEAEAEEEGVAEPGPGERVQERVRQLERREQEAEQIRPPAGLLPDEESLPTVPQARTRFLLTLFGPLARIYDMLIVQTGRVGHYYDDLLDMAVSTPKLLYHALNEPEGVTIGGQYRIRYETLDGRWRRGELGSDQQLAQRTRLYFGVTDIWDPFRAVLELQDSRAFLTDHGSFVNNTHVNQTDVQQLHLDLVSSNFLGSGLYTEFNLGRLNINLGRRRWVARNSFRNATNAFDGASWLLGAQDVWSAQAFAVAPVPRSLESLSEPNMDRRLWGVNFESHHLTWMRTDLYYLGHQDRGPYRDFNMLGGRIRKRPEAGEGQYEVESAYQFGNVSAQGRLQHFQHIEGGFTFDAPWTPQVVLQFDYASRGLDPLYGARAFEYAPTGIFGPYFRSNLLSPGLRLVGIPGEHLSLYLQQRALWLADGRSPWIGSGLHDPTGAAGTFLGHTTDLRAGYTVGENLFLQVGFVHFRYGGVPRRAPDATGDQHSNYAYTSLEFIF